MIVARLLSVFVAGVAVALGVSFLLYERHDPEFFESMANEPVDVREQRSSANGELTTVVEAASSRYLRSEVDIAEDGSDSPVAHPRDIPSHLYREPMTRADISPEWYAYIHLAMLVTFENMQPGLGRSSAAQDYGLTDEEAATLLEVVRVVKEETPMSASKVSSICSAGVSSPQDYVDWWMRFEDEVRAHRRVTVDTLLSALEASIWESVLGREYLAWLEREDFGHKINPRLQIDLADYRVWMRGWCG